MTNQRMAQRKNTVYHTEVVDSRSGKVLGYTVDISDTGMRIFGPESSDPGQVLELRLNLPGKIRGRESIEMQAKVQWCRPDVNPEFFAIGLEIIKPPEELTGILGDLQQKLCFEH
jgi:PilZ domain